MFTNIPKKRRPPLAGSGPSLLSNLSIDLAQKPGPCLRFVFGQCCTNKNCPYDHDIPPGTNRFEQDCPYIAKGLECSRGDECIFRHPEHASSQSNQARPPLRDISQSNSSNKRPSGTSSSQSSSNKRTQSRSNAKVTPAMTMNEESFFNRKPSEWPETHAKLKRYLDKTDAAIRRGNGVDRYSHESEAALLEIRAAIGRYVKRELELTEAKCDENGHFGLRHLSAFKKKVKGCYSLLTHHILALCKSGSGSGEGGICSRALAQLPAGSDLDKLVGVFSVLEETMKSIEEDELLREPVETIMKLSPWVQSYNKVSLELVVNYLEECFYGSAFPGDPMLLAERLLNMGSQLAHDTVRLPPLSFNETVVNAMKGFERVRSIDTWITEESNIVNQLRDKPEGTQRMVEDMLHMNPDHMTGFMLNRLLCGINEQVMVDPLVNVVATNPIGDELDTVASSLRDILHSNKMSNDEKKMLLSALLRGKLKKWYDENRNLYSLQEEVCLRLLAQKAKQVLTDVVEKSDRSGKKTLILVEKTTHSALKDNERETFDALFGYYIGPILRASQQEAARLFRVKPLVYFLVHGSFFIMHAPNKQLTARSNLAADFVSIQSAFVRAGMMNPRTLDKTRTELLAFLIQLQNPLSNSSNIRNNDEIHAIKSNSPSDYHHGNKGKKGLKALINKLVDCLNAQQTESNHIKGIHSVVIASLAMRLGQDDLQAIFTLLGLEIDCSNMSTTLEKLRREHEKLRREQGDRGGPRLSMETRSKMSKGQTDRFRDHNELKAQRNEIYKELKDTLSLPTGITWVAQQAVWVVRIPKRFFGKDIYIASFERLADAEATMEYALKKMADLRARLPIETRFNGNQHLAPEDFEGYFHFDRNDEGNKAILNDITEYGKGISGKVPTLKNTDIL